MDFFEQQKKTRNQSRWILVSFLFALILVAVLIHVVATLVGLTSGGDSSLSTVSAPTKLIIGGIWFTIFAGGFFRWLDVRGGGSCLARRFGAQEVEPASGIDSERELRHVVAEMAVASGQPEPGVWILRRESSINAFVVGSSSPDDRGDCDRALVVSQGALDLLDRKELQGVVAHEFGHLAHGDLLVNMRLLIVLGGLLAVDEVGRLLTGKEPDQFFHPGVVVGLVLRVLGGAGVLTGNLLRAAFSRKREFLADASAIQFTRDKYGLASALDKIRDLYGDGSLHSPYAGELAHLCFHVDRKDSWYRRILATHPTPTARIDVIDPYFSINQRKKSSQQADRVPMPGVPGSTPGGVPEVAQERNATTESPMVTAENQNIRITDRVELMVSDVASATVMLFALFISKDAVRGQHYLSALAFAYDKEFANKVQAMAEFVGEGLGASALHVIELVSPRLNDISADGRQSLLLNLEKLVDAEGEGNLLNYTALQLLRRKLDVRFPVLDKVVKCESASVPAETVTHIRDISKDLALLLSVLVETSGADSAQIERDYERVLSCYTTEKLPRRSAADESVVADMKQAFQKLYAQPLSQREAFVRHCEEIIGFDGQTVSGEKMLLTLFAAALDIPVKTQLAA